MKKTKKIFSRIMALLSAVIFLFGLFVFVTVLRASAGKIPDIFGYSFLQVQTGSMEPEFAVGSIIVTKKVDTDTLNKDDVISFYATGKDIAGKVNTHRIVDININMSGGKQFVTKGDANPFTDEGFVSPDRIIGRVCYNLGPVSGSVMSVLRNPKVIFFVLVVPLILITLGEAVNVATMIANAKFAKDDDDGDEERDDKEKN